MTRDKYTTPEPAEAPQPAGSGAVSGWKVISEVTCACSQKSIDLRDNSTVVTGSFCEPGCQFLGRRRASPRPARLRVAILSTRPMAFRALVT